MNTIDTKKAILDILQDNEPHFFTEIYATYCERTGDLAVGQKAVRKQVENLYKSNLIRRSEDYYPKQGYKYTLFESPDPMARGSRVQIQYGFEVMEPDELLRELWNKNEHPMIKKKLWDGYRLGIIRLLLSCSEGGALNQSEFRDKVTQYRNFLNNHLLEVNSLLNSDVWSAPKQKAILKHVGNDQAQVLLEHLMSYSPGTDEKLPHWE